MDTLDLTKMDLSDYKMDPESEQFRYLKIKSEVWIKKLEEKYIKIIARYQKDDPGNITIRMEKWKFNNKIILLLSDNNDNSYIIINTEKKHNLPNNSKLKGKNIKEEFNNFCEIFDKMILLIE